jgi:hypothetical protein
MNKLLGSELPDRLVKITNDAEAKAFLLAEGILDKLPNQSALAQTHTTEIQTVFCCHYLHTTHWILACRFHGMDDEKENGFMVLAWPKNKWPRSVIEEAIAQQNLGTPNDAKNFTKIDHSEN